MMMNTGNSFCDKKVVQQIIFFYFEKCDAVGQKMFTYGTFKTSSGINVLAF
jgi:hypothetical protein